jgi:hypothetical protein
MLIAKAFLDINHKEIKHVNIELYGALEATFGIGQ